MPRKSFNDILRDAISDVSAFGYDSQKRIQEWLTALRKAAEATLTSQRTMDRMLREGLTAIYKQMIDRGGIVRYHHGLKKFTLENLKPSLRAELDRRIMASADLIKLNRKETIEKTLRRFEGWSTSIPKGGSDAVKKRREQAKIKKSIAGHPFTERRVIIDQGHKLVASISEIIANDQGAVAMIWHSHWREAGYNYREDHKVRDGKVYLLKDSWAKKKGYVKPGKAGYYDDITKVGEEIYCRCYASWIYNLRSLPREMLTEKGKEALRAARQTLSRMDDARADSEDDRIVAEAHQLDLLHYGHELKKVTLVPDRDKWNAKYDPDADEITLEGKFEQRGFGGKLHVMLHEFGHRGQDKDKETYEDFKRRGLNKEEFFLYMANAVHLRDYECRGHLDNIAEEVFAESYAWYLLDLPLPAELRSFWRERMWEQEMIGDAQPVIDFSHDVRWGAVMSRYGNRMYYDRTLPRLIWHDGKMLDVPRAVFEHEEGEFDEILRLVAEFREQHGREPDEAEREQIYLKAHYGTGNPREKQYVIGQGFDYAYYEHWWAAQLARLENRPIRRPPPDPHVTLAHHSRHRLVENVDM